MIVPKRPPRPEYDAAKDGNPLEWICRVSQRIRVDAIERAERAEIEKGQEHARERLISRFPV